MSLNYDDGMNFILHTWSDDERYKQARKPQLEPASGKPAQNTKKISETGYGGLSGANDSDAQLLSSENSFACTRYYRDMSWNSTNSRQGNVSMIFSIQCWNSESPVLYALQSVMMRVAVATTI